MEATYPKSIIEAVHAVMQEVGYVQKKGTNSFHKYNYAGEADLLQALRPAMLKNGLVLIPSSKITGSDDFGNTHVEVAYTLAHTDGSVWPHPITAAGSGNDKNSKGGVGDKGTYKAITGANKYLLFKLFQIETGDDPEVASEADKGGPPDNTVPDDWEIYAQDLTAKIGRAKTAPEVTQIWKDDGPDLAQLKLAHLPTYTRLYEHMAARKKELSPNKEAA